MRWPTILLAGIVLLPSGCSLLIGSYGTRLDELKTPEEVQAEFGEPDEVRKTKDGSYDVYYTRRKIADNWLVRSKKAMGSGYTLGLIEFFWFPQELASLTARTAFGREVLFQYAKGKTVDIKLDGEDYLPPNGSAETRATTATETSPPPE